MPHPPALSTMWMQLRHDTLAAFIQDAQRLGIDHVELSHVVTPAQIEALPAPLAPTVRVLHHPCPNPGGVPELSEVDEARRTAAVAHATQSIAWAARLGARVVVMHLGIVELDRRWENALRARWLQGEAQGEHYARVGRAPRHAARRPAAPHLDAARRSLAALVPVAARHGLRLALENGEWVAAIPSLDEARSLLAEFDPATVGLWLDTGHATILERLGFDTLLAWARLAPERLLGLHYHDVHGLRDHLIPGNGTIDWPALAPHLPAHALPTCEFDWYYTPDEIRAGVAHLVAHGLVGVGG